MKATITKNGALIVNPENSTEHYALKKWSENYRTDGKMEDASVLIIDITDTDSDLNLPRINH